MPSSPSCPPRSRRSKPSLQAAEAERGGARRRRSRGRAAAAAAKLASQELETELATLTEAARRPCTGDWSPIVEEIQVAAGYEQALGAALGDDLDAASDEAAPSHWRLTTAARRRPGSARRRHAARANSSTAPRRACAAASARSAWSRPTHGRALQAQLKPGQRLVSTDGDLWRWDGYSVQAGTASAAGARLIERSRLDRARRREFAQGARPRRRGRGRAGRRHCQGGSGGARPRRCAKRQGRRMPSSTARASQIAAAEHEALATSKELGALAEALTRTRAGLDEARAHGSTSGDGAARACFPLARWKPHSKRRKPRPPRAASARARADATLEGFEREVRSARSAWKRSARKRSCGRSASPMRASRSQTLRAREEETSADLAALENLPAEIEQRRMKLFDAIAAAERERAKAADDLALAETALKGREKALREVQERLAEAREARARSEARLEAARERRGESARAIRDQLDCTPEDCLALAGLKPGAPIPPLADVEARLAETQRRPRAAGRRQSEGRGGRGASSPRSSKRWSGRGPMSRKPSRGCGTASPI